MTQLIASCSRTDLSLFWNMFKTYELIDFRVTLLKIYLNIALIYDNIRHIKHFLVFIM